MEPHSRKQFCLVDICQEDATSFRHVALLFPMTGAEVRESIGRVALDRAQVQGKSTRSSSKYDYVKIRVWLGPNREHHYVLSRYLISRMLTVTRVPQEKAVKIALEVKKRLVDNNKLDITQEELELELFASLKMWGFGDDNVERFRMTMRFQQERRPLIVLIIGSACTGKSSLAQALASRLNLPNVLQTDMLGSLLPAPTAQRVASSGTLSWLADFPKDRGVDDVPVDTSPSNASAHGTDTAGVVSQFVEECKVMWRALQGDLHKCVLDGKSIIIEGLYLDPGILLSEFEGRIVGTGSHSLPSLASGDDVSPQQCKLPRVRSCNGDDNAQNAIIQNLSTLEVRDRKTSSDPGDAAAWSEEEVGHPARPVIVPLILRMDEDDYPIVAEEWLRTRLSPESDGLARQKLLSRLIAVQQYLAGYEAADMHVLHTGILDFQKTLDAMHDICLFGMELALQAPPCEVGAGCRAPKQCQP